MELQLLAGVVVCFALTFSVFACILGGIALLKVMALEKSTHSIQYMPVDEALKGDQWATNDTVLADQNKLFKESLEEELPDFLSDDDDKKIKSF